MQINDPMLKPILLANPALKAKAEALAEEVDLKSAAKDAADIATEGARAERSRALVEQGSFLQGEANFVRQPDPTRKREHEDAVARATNFLARCQDRAAAASRAYVQARELRDACFAYMIDNAQRENVDDY